jgi:hypothetical protein
MRQAVVIIHGIGEQRPMQTLREFVAGVLDVPVLDLACRAFSKPDRISDTLELRRLSVPRQGPCNKQTEYCETDFYELYWQHLMQGTSWRPVLEWIHSLLHPGRLNDRLLELWMWAFAVVVTAVGLGGVAWWQPKGRLAWPGLADLPTIIAILLVVLGLFQWLVRGRADRFFLGFLGDAVRYLNPDPPNIEARRAIRTAGLTLLRGLHEDALRRYERIILVGHSLGSVIAYDLITWFWQEQHHLVELDRLSDERKIVKTFPLETAPVPDKSPLSGFGDPFGCPFSHTDRKKLREHQRELWQSHRDKGLPWLITDLFTLGSPLAHADVLLAANRDMLRVGQSQREFPTCPPQPEDGRDHGLLWRRFGETERRHVRILHHGAPFAVTRWTNLYFRGDIVGGPLADLFGKGIKDVPLGPHSKRGGLGRWGWRSHTHYWDRQAKACGELCKALERNEGKGAGNELPTRSA